EPMARGKALGVAVHQPMHHRVRGYALRQGGSADEAGKVLRDSLEAGRHARADHEVALTLEALLRADQADTVGPSDQLEAERNAIFDRLGMISSPRIPLLAGAEGIGDL